MSASEGGHFACIYLSNSYAISSQKIPDKIGQKIVNSVQKLRFSRGITSLNPEYS